METPLCSVCLENDDILCNGCQSKVDEEELDEIAVDISRFLQNLSERIKTLQDVEILEIRKATDAIVIITAKGDGPRVVGKNGEVVKELAKEFDQSIRVVENSDNVEEVIKNLLEPVEVQSINTVYKPDGTEKKVVVDEDDKRRVPISTDDFTQLVKQITDKEYSLSFE